MSHRKSSVFTGKDRGRRSSPIIWIAIGVFVLFFFVFPFFGGNLRYLVSSAFSPLKTIGNYLQCFGIIVIATGIVGLFFSSRRAIKIALVGVLILAIGLFLGNPLNLYSFFLGRSNSRGYHFFLLILTIGENI